MKDSVTVMLGVGVTSSKNRAEEAAEKATLAPLIGSPIQSATGVISTLTQLVSISRNSISLKCRVHQRFSDEAIQDHKPVGKEGISSLKMHSLAVCIPGLLETVADKVISLGLDCIFHLRASTNWYMGLKSIL